MDKKAFWLYIIGFTKDQKTNFDEDFSDILSQQLRALFTSYCLVFDINADTAESDVCLWDIFDMTGLDDKLQEDFENFMLGFLV